MGVCGIGMIACVFGGLGNQMFQFAAASALASKLDLHLSVCGDMDAVYGQQSQFLLNKVFGVEVDIAGPKDLRSAIGWLAWPQVRRLFAKIHLQRLAQNGVVFEPHFKYWSSFGELIRVDYLHGYWQCPRYFEGYEADIRRAFQFRGELAPADSAVLRMMRAQPSVAIHIRRGDYTNSKNSQVYVQLGRDYYKSAMRLMRDKISDPRFFVFSDDPNWVRQNIIDDDSMVLVDHNNGATSFNDMRLMSLADHNIIANSTFSWWGAWLNANPGKVVIAPKTWFLSSKMDSSDVCPYDWIRL